MLTEYTTCDDIRAALGVSEEEISDSTLGLSLYETLLNEDLLAVDALLVSTWVALPAVDSRNAAQLRLGNMVSLYSTYAVAYRLTDSVELFGFLKVADGRASTERTGEAFENLRANSASMLARLRGLLLAALQAIVPATVTTATVFSWVSSTGIAADPVTT